MTEDRRAEISRFVGTAGHALDELFNGELRGGDRHTGFALMAWPFGSDPGDCYFISNCERESLIAMMGEMIQQLKAGAI